MADSVGNNPDFDDQIAFMEAAVYLSLGMIQECKAILDTLRGGSNYAIMAPAKALCGGDGARNPN